MGVGVGVGVGVGEQLQGWMFLSLRAALVALEDMGDKYASLRRAQLHLDFIHANS